MDLRDELALRDEARGEPDDRAGVAGSQEDSSARLGQQREDLAAIELRQRRALGPLVADLVELAVGAGADQQAIVRPGRGRRRGPWPGRPRGRRRRRRSGRPRCRPGRPAWVRPSRPPEAWERPASWLAWTEAAADRIGLHFAASSSAGDGSTGMRRPYWPRTEPLVPSRPARASPAACSAPPPPASAAVPA